MRGREALGGLPRARRAQAVKPGSLSSERIGYSSGPARTACGVEPSLKSAPTHNGALISWLPERRRYELLRRLRIAAAVHHRRGWHGRRRFEPDAGLPWQPGERGPVYCLPVDPAVRDE